MRPTLDSDLFSVRRMAELVAGQALVLSRILGRGATDNQSLVVLHHLNAANRVGQLLVVEVPRDVGWRGSVHLALDVDLGPDANLLAISQVQAGSDGH